jgi:hypothetical protein
MSASGIHAGGGGVNDALGGATEAAAADAPSRGPAPASAAFASAAPGAWGRGRLRLGGRCGSGTWSISSIAEETAPTSRARAAARMAGSRKQSALFHARRHQQFV